MFFLYLHHLKRKKCILIKTSESGCCYIKMVKKAILAAQLKMVKARFISREENNLLPKKNMLSSCFDETAKWDWLSKRPDTKELSNCKVIVIINHLVI